MGYEAHLVGYDEESNALVLAMDFGVFMLELDSMQFRTLSKSSRWGTKIHYPYRNFFTAGNTFVPRVTRFNDSFQLLLVRICCIIVFVIKGLTRYNLSYSFLYKSGDIVENWQCNSV